MTAPTKLVRTNVLLLELAGEVALDEGGLACKVSVALVARF
jgi:hypothetical protein